MSLVRFAKVACERIHTGSWLAQKADNKEVILKDLLKKGKSSLTEPNQM
jgi:hypothetical protein